jgi:drug/metabolite transporter (DMT)-like permease
VSALRNNPLFLLLVTGLMLGMNFPLGKLALARGMDPLVWSMLISLLPGLVLTALLILREGRIWSLRETPFAVFAGLAAYVIPNIITFSAIPHIGSGLASLTFALSPVMTALLSLLLGVRPPNAQLLIGVALGFAGAILIALARDGLNLGGGPHWLFLAFVIPVSLACGNVYRTAQWPEGMSPLRMAAAATVVSGVMQLGLVLALRGPGTFRLLTEMPGLSALQVATSLAQFLFFFRLQWIGGPTYLSQIGYVAAAVGLAAGVTLLGETYPALVWAGAGAIAAGVVVSNWRPFGR